MTELLTQSEKALNTALGKLKAKGYVFYGIHKINKKRYIILQGLGMPSMMLMYKKEWFKSYGQIRGTDDGYGETVNKEHLRVALSHNCRLLARTDGEDVWIANLHDFILSGFQRVCNEGVETISNSAKLFTNIEKAEVI